jgi:hypothetical protein
MLTQNSETPGASQTPAIENQPAKSDDTVPPKRRKGQHRDDCACGWCERKRQNALAKKNAANNPPKEKVNLEKSQPANGSGAASKSSSAPKSKPRAASPMAAKIAGLKTETLKTTDAKPASEKKEGWFGKLFSGATFFED